MERQPQGTTLAAVEVRFYAGWLMGAFDDGLPLLYGHLCLTSTTLLPTPSQVTNGPIAAMGS